MITKINPNPDEIVAELADPIAKAFSGLVHGSMQAKEHFARYNLPINKPLAADLTRFHAGDFLRKDLSGQNELYLLTANNNGIRIRDGIVKMKVVKGLDGVPPAPNRSVRDKKFYSQTDSKRYLPFGSDFFRPFDSHEWDSFAKSANNLNLILCWTADDAHNISSVSLVCPSKIWTYRQSAEVFWRREIPVPNAMSSMIPDLNTEYGDPDDLEIFFDDAEDLTGTNND